MGASTRSYPTRRCPPWTSPAEVPCSRGERGVQPRPCPSACRVSGRGLGRPPQRCHLFAGTGRIERLAQPSGVGGRRGSAGGDPTSNQRPGLGLGRGGCQHPGRVLIGDQVVPNRGRDPPGTVQNRARGGGGHRNGGREFVLLERRWRWRVSVWTAELGLAGFKLKGQLNRGEREFPSSSLAAGADSASLGVEKIRISRPEIGDPRSRSQPPPRSRSDDDDNTDDTSRQRG